MAKTHILYSIVTLSIVQDFCKPTVSIYEAMSVKKTVVIKDDSVDQNGCG